MKEVATRALSVVLDSSERHGISLEEIVAGLPISAGQLRDPSERIDWDHFCTILERVEDRGGSKLIGEASFTRSPVMSRLGSVFGLFSNARAIYWASHKWANQALFTIIGSTFEDLPDHRIKLSVTIPDQFRDSQAFFRLCAVTLSAVPTLLGQGPALLEWSSEARRAVYLISPPKSRAVLGRVRRSINLLWSSKGVVEELSQQQALLHARYQDLLVLSAEKAAQSERLQRVNDLAQVLTQHTSVTGLVELVGQLLEEHAQGCGFRVWVRGGSGALEIRKERGRPESSPLSQWPLVHGGELLGRIEIWGPDTTSDKLRTFLNDLFPWVALALANATAFTTLERYRARLSITVDERTAELRKTTEQLEHALEHQRRLDQQRAEFFANASHELRTPLTLIISPLESLLSSGRLPSDLREDLRDVMYSAARMMKRVNDLLDLSKLEVGKMALHLTSMDLVPLLEAVTRSWREVLKQRKIDLTLSLPESLHLRADAERLEQVVLNLMSNAVKYTPDGGWVKISAERSEATAHFVVENNGRGIATEDMPQLFHRFAQSAQASSRRFGSTGLGLPLVRELVELHGGTIEVSNSPGERVAFSVRIPVTEGTEERTATPPMPSAELLLYEAASEAPPAAWEPPAPKGERPLILIAEDNSELRTFLGRAIFEEFDVVLAPDGRAALSAALKHLPDVVLTDWMMPYKDGNELCRALKSDPATESIPVILLTARGETDAKLIGLKGGADDYLVKPCSTDEVVLRLKAQLRLRKLGAQLAQREKLAAIGTIVAGVAHEIRNPLNGILNSLGPLSELTPGGSEQSELIEFALEGARRVERISSQLLRQARAGEGARVEVNLADNVRNAVELLAYKVSKGPSIVWKARSPHIRVIGEPAALHQVWLNLLDNAIDATGPTGEIQVCVEIQQDNAIVEIADNGPGVPAVALKRIFDPFYTTKPVGRGTGLGLHVVRDIVSQHGGSIDVQSSQGNGARFTVTLPIV